MRLEGTLDAFSLPDIFQLLSFTKKSGALHLRREDVQPLCTEQHGVVHLNDGLVTGARSAAGRQALGRRLVGSGLVSDEALADAVETLLEHPEQGLGRALATAAGLDSDLLRGTAREQATDAVFDLLRWPDGAFAFVVDEQDPDDVGGTLTVEDLVAEAQSRIDRWSALQARVPSSSAVVLLSSRLDAPPALERDEWSLLCLVDGRRSVADLVDVFGRGEYVVVKVLAGLVERGVVAIDEPPSGVSGAQRRQALLAALEGNASPATAVVALDESGALPPESSALEQGGGPSEAAAEVVDEQVADDEVAVTAEAAPTRSDAEVLEALEALEADASGETHEHESDDAHVAPRAAAVIPDRPEPFTPPRQPDHHDAPALSRVSATTASAVSGTTSSSVAGTPGHASGHGTVQGAHALQPDSSYIERDPSVNKSLLLRLIAGVRGL